MDLKIKMMAWLLLAVIVLAMGATQFIQNQGILSILSGLLLTISGVGFIFTTFIVYRSEKKKNNQN